ncbi:MAG TPA: DUF1592 domain-containing protein [Polyangiaceae bacterium]
MTRVLRTRSRVAPWGPSASMLAAALVLGACVGSIGDKGSDGTGNAGPAGHGGPGDPGSGTSPGSGNGGAAGSPNAPPLSADKPLVCPAAVSPAPAPLGRLTDLEYQNTVRDLFPGITVPAVSLPADNIVEGFDNNSKAQTPSPSLIEQYRASAQAIAAAAIAKLDAVLPCAATSASQEDTCGKQLIDDLGARAFRRPLAPEERDRLITFFTSARTTYDFKTAVSMVIQAVLQSPQFLYRVELGGPPDKASAPLTSYEIASRLSYFFWDTTPDSALRDAAAQGALGDAAGVETQARRLLADPRAHDAVANFHRQWLRFEKMDRLVKNTTAFPSWSDDVATAMRGSAAMFVDHVFWDKGGSLDALLREPSAYVNDLLAPLYGLPPPGTANLTLVDTDPLRRSGVLTQVGLMAGFAHETADSPVLRGVFVMDRFFCAAPPPPPPGVNTAVPELVASDPKTTRDRFALTHESGDCATCHHAIDGYGFGFSHYDAVGQWRDTENGFPINAKGWIGGTRDADGDFDGAIELGERMAKSKQVAECVTTQWFRYALGLGAKDVDRCAVAPVVQTLADKNGDLREVLVATVTSEAFRHRPEITP